MKLMPPQLQYRIQPALIGLEFQHAHLEIKQPMADLKIRQPMADQHIEQPLGDLEIDQTRALDALALTKPTVVTRRIYSQSPYIAMKSIARIVDEGNQMAAIHEKRNVFAEIAKSRYPMSNFPQFKYAGEASLFNVDIEYTAKAPIIEHVPKKPEIEVKVNKPQMTYTPWNVHVYMRQWPKLEIIPPEIDIFI